MVRLTEIFRQAATSRTITTAHRINRGEMPDLAPTAADSDFHFVSAEESEGVISDPHMRDGSARQPAPTPLAGRTFTVIRTHLASFGDRTAMPAAKPSGRTVHHAPAAM